MAKQSSKVGNGKRSQVSAVSPPGSAPEKTTASSTLPTLDTEAFRRQLARLVDPLGPRAGAAGRENLKQASSRLCSILAHLYGVDEKDRTKLWEHIGKARGRR